MPAEVEWTIKRGKADLTSRSLRDADLRYELTKPSGVFFPVFLFDGYLCGLRIRKASVASFVLTNPRA